MDEKSSVQEPKSVEKELLLLDLRRIFWLAPLGLLLTFALLATMHFLKRDLTLEGFSLIDFKNPSFEQIWADAVNIVPEDFDPLTWLLTFLTFDVAIVVVIVMDGKSRIKGTIELFSSASIGTSIVILFLTGMLSPCLMDRNGTFIGLVSILFISVWACILANASKILTEEERITRVTEEQKKKLESDATALRERLSNGIDSRFGEKTNIKWFQRLKAPVLVVFVPYFLVLAAFFAAVPASVEKEVSVPLFIYFVRALGQVSIMQIVGFICQFLCCVLICSSAITAILVPMLLDIAVGTETQPFFRKVEQIAWLMLVSFYIPVVHLGVLCSLWSPWPKFLSTSGIVLTIALVVICLCSLFLISLPRFCTSKKNSLCYWINKLFDRYRHYSFHKSLRRITENLQRMEDFGSATPVFGLKRKEIQDEDLANAPALDVEQSLDERLAVLERQTAALLNATQRLELSTSRMKKKNSVRCLFSRFNSADRSSGV